MATCFERNEIRKVVFNILIMKKLSFAFVFITIYTLTAYAQNMAQTIKGDIQKEYELFESDLTSSSVLHCEMLSIDTAVASTYFSQNNGFNLRSASVPQNRFKKFITRVFAYWDVKNNLLYDAAAIPNIGIDIDVKKQWSIAGNWHYAWWSKNVKHNYWRTYGGDIEARKWFGRLAKEKPLQGHHVGVYAQIITYDFELGGRGYLGDKWSYGGGYRMVIHCHCVVD